MSLLPRPESQQLDISSVIPVLGGCNTELKCVALEPLASQASVPMSERVMYDATLLSTTGALLPGKLTPNLLGTTLAKLPAGLIDISHNPSTGKREYALTKAGLLAAAVGGHMLQLSETSSKSVRLFAGEYAGDVSGQDRINSLEARLIVMCGLYTHARNKWRASTDLYSKFEKFGLGPRSAAAHLERLKKCGLVETKITKYPNGRKEGYHRIQPHDSDMYYDPAKIIHRYLAIVGKFAHMDIDFLNDGLFNLTRICHDEAKFPFLVKRSFASTTHTKKTDTPRSPRPDGARMPIQ